MSDDNEKTVDDLRAEAETVILSAIVHRAKFVQDGADLLMLAQALAALSPRVAVQHAEAIVALRTARQFLATIHCTPVNDGRTDGGVTRIDCAPTLAIINGALDGSR